MGCFCFKHFEQVLGSAFLGTPTSFSTLGKQSVQQWLKIDRHEDLISCEAFLSAAGLGPAHKVKHMELI